MSETDHPSEDNGESPSNLRVTKRDLEPLRDAIRWAYGHHIGQPTGTPIHFTATTYDRFLPVIRKAAAAHTSLALADWQTDRVGRDVPAMATYLRVFDTKEETGHHPKKRIQNLLLVGRCLVKLHEGQEGWEEQWSRLERLIEGLGCDERAAVREAAQRSWPELDDRFVPLALMPDRDAGFRGREGLKDAYDDLGEFLRDTPEHPVTVLLGGPGAGKTTLLRHLERQCLESGTAVQPLFVPMAEYRPTVPGGPLPEPLPWLETVWAQRHGKGAPRLEDRLRLGRVSLLLDAVNEVPAPDPVVAAMHALGGFVGRYVLPFLGNRVVVSCRPLDYVASLPLGGLDVPVVRVQRMDAAGIARFVEKSGRALPKEVAAELAREAPSLSLYGVPYFLKMLLESSDDAQPSSIGRAQVFTRYVWRLLRREIEKGPGRLGEPLLAPHDRAHIMNAPTLPESADLPEDGFLFPFLAEFAFRLQEAVDRKANPSLWKEAVRALSVGQPSGLAYKAIEAACSIGLLERELGRGLVGFHHQLLQEYFAGRRMVQGFDPERWRVAWKIGEVAPFVPTSEGERLPPAKGTGWEETTVMAASMVPDPDAFVASILERNVTLAGRCASSPEVRIGASIAKRVQEELLGRMRDEEADLRSRIAAGLAVEDLSFLGYEIWESAGKRCLVPPMVHIEGGSYLLGRKATGASGVLHHANALTLSEVERAVGDFQIGAYPVTNAEFACFIADGGYDDESWWHGEDSKAWRLGDGEAQGLRHQMRQNLQIDRAWGSAYLREQVGRRWSKEEAEARVDRLGWTPERYEEWLESHFPSGCRLTLPGEWTNGEFNAPSQPVVGVSWFEANAYCAWLSAQASSRYRLLTEYEYEAAATGRERRAYAYGSEFDPAQCNSYPSRIWRPTPVGLYRNPTPEGAYDLTGNVWTWTSSTDDALGGVAPGATRRVNRGGSYDTAPELAMTFCRDSNQPGYRDRYVGFRLAIG